MASTDRVMSATEAPDLPARLRSGDPDAFAEFVRLFQIPVYRAALAALGSPADAEEAAQDAFVSAFKRIETFRGESSLKTWVVAIAWRKALTRRRKLQWLRLRTVTPRADGELDPLDAVMETGADPHAETVATDLKRQLRELIRALPPKLRDPLLLVASGEHSYEDVASVLGIPVGTAKWRVSEARRVLRVKLQRLGYGR